MFTTCNECGTVFRVSPAELRVAEGQVRCGHCSATFNALATLTDEPPPTTVLPQLQVQPHLEPEPEPEFDAEPEPGSDDEPDITALDAVTSDEGLEFNVPEDNWSEFFVEASTPRALPPLVAIPEPEPEPVSTASTDTASINYVPEDWQELLGEVSDDDPDEAPIYYIDQERPDSAIAAEAGPALDIGLPVDSDGAQEPGENTEPADTADSADSGATSLGTILPVINPILIERPFEWQPDHELVAGTPRRRWGFAVGAAILALALLLQTIHYQRDDLAARPALNRPLTRIYGALNLSLLPNWNLHAYEVRGSEAVAGATSRGALDVLAHIAVVGSEPVGLPMVRITLRDRFAKSLGSRVFNPAEYLDGIAQPATLLTPGYLIPVKISLRDPGTDAFGYEVDVCVLYRREGLLCQQERDQKVPFTR